MDQLGNFLVFLWEWCSFFDEIYIFFVCEGQVDYKVLVFNVLFCISGFFKSVGRMVVYLFFLWWINFVWYIFCSD